MSLDAKTAPLTTLTTLVYQIFDAVSTLPDTVTTAALFSQSDLVPIIGPTLAVAMVLAGPTDVKHFIHGFIWLELHLIAFEIKNQICGLEEDKISKPNRPIASGRISVQDAHRLYYAVLALAFGFSVYHNLTLCSIIYIVAIFAYNEGNVSVNCFMKSFLGSIGYVCYCWGTTFIFDHHKPLSPISSLAIIISGAIHTTTGHAQDFRDRTGDAAIGRKTLPILLPQGMARWSLMLLVHAWTAGLIYLWQPPLLVSAGFATLGVNAMVKFLLDYSEEADRESYWWYNMWLITAHMLPLFARLAAAQETLFH